MRKLLSLSIMALLLLGVMPVVFAAGIGEGIGGDIDVEEFPPIVWQCNDRTITDDNVQPWRCTDRHYPLDERTKNYLFEGEKYAIDVVVFDKNKIDEVAVDLILGENRGDAYSTLNCVEIPHYEDFKDCNARIGEEEIHEYDKDVMQAYRCTVTILDSEHMYGKYWLTVQADDGINEPGYYDEVTPLWLNPVIELNIEGDLNFDEVRPGTYSYSQVEIENSAEGGVLLDMFITGKDWPAADPDMGRCQLVDTNGNPHNGLVNYLALGAFRYYAENGAYDTRTDAETEGGAVPYNIGFDRNSDSEGYVNIQRQLNAGFEEAMFDDAEIIQAGGPVACYRGYSANVLSPGGSMALTFRLDLPEPCYGSFESAESGGEDGSIFIWAEAI